MAHIRMVGAQQEAWVNARKFAGTYAGMESRWRDSLAAVGPVCGRVAKKTVRLPSSNLDCTALEQWCDWFRSHRAALQKDGEPLALDVVDFSCNRIGDHGLAALADILLEQPPRVLRLFNNLISDASPIEQLLVKGGLREAHLSNNKLQIDAAVRLVLAAVLATDEHGQCLFPTRGAQPLWLRVENSKDIVAMRQLCFSTAPEAVRARASSGCSLGRWQHWL